jgi:uncharacterized membrane protein
MSKDVMPDLIRHPIYSWVPACAGMTIIVAKVIIYYAFINSLIIVFMTETITISVVFPANTLIWLLIVKWKRVSPVHLFVCGYAVPYIPGHMPDQNLE